MAGVKIGSPFVKKASSNSVEKSTVSRKNVKLMSTKKKKTVSTLLDARGIWVETQLMGMNLNQLRKIADEIDISFTKETKRDELQKKIGYRIQDIYSEFQ